MKSYKMATMADFTNSINPADRRAIMLAGYLEKNNFEITPIRNLSYFGWFKTLFKNYDIVHTRGWPAERYTTKILSHKYHVHTIIGHFKGEPESYAKVRKWLCKKADIVHIGYLISKKIIMSEGVPEEKIRLIHNPIDTNLFTPKKRNNKRIKILYISSYFERKKPQIVVQLAKKFPSFDFVMYGSHADNNELFNQIFKKSKKLSNLSVNKSIDYYELPKIYQSADMFIFPSTQGEFGNVVIEAISSGLPVIAMNEGAGEVIKHGVNGFLCNKLDEFDNYVETLAEDEKLRIKMGKESRKVAIKEFSKDIVFKKYLDMYMELLER